MPDSRGGREDRNKLRAATLLGVAAEVRTFLIIIYCTYYHTNTQLLRYFT